MDTEILGKWYQLSRNLAMPTPIVSTKNISRLLNFSFWNAIRRDARICITLTRVLDLLIHEEISTNCCIKAQNIKNLLNIYWKKKYLEVKV